MRSPGGPLSLVVALAALRLAAGEAAAAPAPVLWNGLAKGPFEVGFRVVTARDFSRTWWPAKTIDGKAATTEQARPVRISVWYPAARARAVMTYEGYVQVRSTGGVREIDDTLARQNRYSLRAAMKDEAAMKGLLAAKMVATKDAPPARGRFPVVLYSAGLNESWQHANAMLAEYVASHGYVVAAVPQVGESSLNGALDVNPVDMEMQARDVEFAYGWLRGFPAADRSRAVVMGHSMGGVVGLIVAMRNAAVQGVIGLDGAFRAAGINRSLRKSPWFRPRELRVPLLDLRRRENNLDGSVINDLKYSQKYLGEFDEIQHADFTDFAFIAARYATTMAGRTPADAAAARARMCQLVLQFLDARLKGDANAERALAAAAPPGAKFRMSIAPGTAPPPTEDELLAVIRARGAAEAIRRYQEAQQREPGVEIVSKDKLLSIGYGLLPAGEAKLAVSVFQLLTAAYPASPEAYDSLADACVAAGDDVGMRAAYGKVLELLPKDTVLDTSTKATLRQNAEQGLKATKP